MAGTIVADNIQAASTSTLVLKNGVASTPPTIQDSAGTEIGTFCRAFVNFNGTGTIAIRASFNVSSITDVNTGRYVVNITTAMPDANGAAVGTAIPGTASDANSNRIVYAACISTTTVRLNITSTTSGTDWQDSEFVSLAVFR